MSNTLQNAKEMMEKGWHAREEHEFNEAEKLLTNAKEIFEEEEDWFNVTECLNHLAYNEKLRGITHMVKGFELAKESLEIAKEKNSKDVFANRAALSLSDAMGNFEQALRYANKTLKAQKDGADKADMLAHIAKLQLRLGDIEKAKKQIKEATEMLDKYYEDATEPHRDIWKTKLLAINALIEYNSGNKKQALKLAKEALELAKEKNLKTRTTQVSLVLEHISE